MSADIADVKNLEKNKFGKILPPPRGSGSLTSADIADVKNFEKKIGNSLPPLRKSDPDITAPTGPDTTLPTGHDIVGLKLFFFLQGLAG